MPDIVTSAVLLVGGNAVVLAIAGWIVKALVAHRMNLDVESFKLQLSATCERELTLLRANLEQAQSEKQIRFSALHDKRADVIAKLYEHVVDLYEAGESFLSVFQSGRDTHPERLQQLSKALQAALSYFQRHRLYFPEHTCERVSEFFTKVADIASKLSFHVNMREDHRNMKEMSTDWNEAWKKFQKDIPELRRALEDDFRVILGGGDSF